MPETSRIKLNPQIKEIEIEGTEVFVKKHFILRRAYLTAQLQSPKKGCTNRTLGFKS